LNSETFWTAVGLVLIFEGMLPLISPARWRRVFSQVMQMQDGQIRFFGLCSAILGLMVWILLA
jgi:hypothetical protein